jgi:hypothetical protein
VYLLNLVLLLVKSMNEVLREMHCQRRKSIKFPSPTNPTVLVFITANPAGVEEGKSDTTRFKTLFNHVKVITDCRSKFDG